MTKINKFDVVLVNSELIPYLLPDFWTHIIDRYYMCMVDHQIMENKVGQKIFNCIDILKSTLDLYEVTGLIKRLKHNIEQGV